MNFENESALSNTAGIIVSSSSKHKLSINNPSTSLISGTDNVFNLNYVEKELECQICLSPLESPVPLPCGSHSLCQLCITSLFKHQKKQKDGFRTISCPSCGVLSGIKKLKKIENIPVNRELERFQKAYEKEKALWINEKLQLETQLNTIKNIEEEIKSSKDENTKKKNMKKALTDDEENGLKQMLKRFGPEKLKEAQILISNNLKANKKVGSTPTKKSTRRAKDSVDKDDSQRTTPSKSGPNRKRSTSQKGFWDLMDETPKLRKNAIIKRDNTVSINQLEKREYPLRNLKKTKTAQI